MGGQHIRSAIASSLIMGMLVGCAGGPFSETVERSLEADPQLEESPPFETTEESESQDGADEADPEVADAEVSVDPSADPSMETDPESEDADARPNVPEPGEPDFIGPVWSARASRPEPEVATAAAETSSISLAGVPDDLTRYVRDLRQLGLLEMRDRETGATESSTDTDASNTSAATTESESTVDAPQSPFARPISRREYARWLFQTYNTFYADESVNRLRPGTEVDTPAFTDVPATDPDYAAIQGLAEAGIIPSAFGGNSTAVNFRPDDPLVREDLILWKVPLDTREALPTTTPETVTETWGFQDTTEIEPLALRAIAADYPLGDFSNFRRAFGYTTLFRPDKSVTRAEAAAVLWRFGTQTEGRTAVEVAERSSGASS